MVINEMLKFGPNILVPAITKLFNLVLKSGNFPSAWNTNFQVPLFKKGDLLSCDNYRGISITSCFTGYRLAAEVNRQHSECVCI